jgi:broad specificity phosphatase PhoE
MQGGNRARSLALRALFFCALATCAAPAIADEALWKRIAQGGVTVMIRHAQTVPGVGDPPHFRLEDCSTQRNLSEEGRAHARRVRAAFKARGISTSRVLSSQWCRCIETAELAFRRHRPEPALNSLFGARHSEPAQSAAVRKLVAAVKRGEVLVLVTHQVNITAIIGTAAAPGELIVLAPTDKGVTTLVGRMTVP